MDEAVQIAKAQTEMMWNIGRKEAALFEANNVGYTETVVLFSGRRKLMVWIYCLLRNYKKITAIENLEHDVKLQMWGFVKEICAGKTNDVKKMKEVAKAFYALEYFLNENNNK